MASVISFALRLVVHPKSRLRARTAITKLKRIHSLAIIYLTRSINIAIRGAAYLKKRIEKQIKENA